MSLSGNHRLMGFSGQPRIVAEREVRFTRRRYGKRNTYTWAHVRLGDNWVCLGDPWPGVHWPAANLERAIENVTTCRQ